MSITNYAELQTSVANWLKRSDLTNLIPDFITLAEAALNRMLRVRQMSSVYSRTVGSNVIQLPDDFLEADHIELDGNTLTFTPKYYAESSTINSGRWSDRLYTMIGDQIWLMTTVGTNSVFRMWYFQRLVPLSTEEPINWLLEDAPDVYLFGALIQAEPYMKNDARIATWQGLYNDCVANMAQADNRARTHGSALVMRKG
jgi:hypothetical protein